MLHREIFKYDNSGNLRSWRAETAPCGTMYRTHTGIVGRAMVTSAPTQCVGNRQRPSAVDQCTFEVAALYEHRLARTFHETPEAARTGAHFFEPMLAQKFSEKHFAPGDYVQAKYDGARNIGSSSGCISRQGKEFLSVPHIVEAVNRLLDDDPDFMGDGELYGHGLPRQQIMSLIKKAKNFTQADLAASKSHVRWYLYDLPSLGHLSFEDRYARLLEYTKTHPHLFAEPEFETVADPRPFVVVPTYKIQTMERFTAFHAHCVARGLEGSIYRKAAALYENKRSWGLLKRKDFMDDEFEPLSFIEGNGNWAGAAKTMACRALPLSAPDYGPDNPLYHKRFYPTLTGSYDRNAKLLRDFEKSGAVPNSVTVKYFDLSEDSVPQHCNVMDLWWEGRDV